MGDLPLVLTLVLLVVTGLAAISDLRSFTIPNTFPILVAILFVVALPFLQMPIELMLSHLGAGVLGFIIGFVFFILGLMGGGDVKLFAALCLFTPLSGLAGFAAAVAIAGGIFSAGILLGVWLRRRLAPIEDGPQSFSKVRVPYGVGIFTGLAMMVLPF